MASRERTAHPRVVKLQRLLRCLTNARQADNEQVIVNESEVVGPSIAAWVEETVRVLAQPPCDLLRLAHIAKCAGPSEVVEMIGTARVSGRTHR